jgi:pantoate kinase
MDPKVRKAIQVAQMHGLASMCMLGNAVFAVGDTDKIFQNLLSLGKPIVCNVNKKGLRIID